MSIEARGSIAHISMVAIKSTHQLELSQARLTKSGIETVEGGLRDHDFMLISAAANADGEHEFVQQRQPGMNIMTQVLPHFENGVLTVSWANKDSIIVPLDYTNGTVIPVKIWKDVCQAVDQGDDLAQWFSEHLGKPVRLVRAIDPSFSRITSQRYLVGDNQVRFQDGYPIHWFPQEDVTELEEKSGVKLGWERFRPQIIGKGFEAQFVHAILSLTIAGILCEQPKPCERCPIPQIDPDTGEKTAEPNRTLMKYKAWRNMDGEVSPIFGENINPKGEGIISVGDEIQVVSLRPVPLVYGVYSDIKKN